MVTINDVAKHAGVSKSTVSLVINNSSKVKPSTKERVLEVIRELGYTPNLSAIELTTKKRLTLGMIQVTNCNAYMRNSFDIMDINYFNDVSSGIHKEMRKYNYGILMEQFVAIEENADKIPKIVQTNRTDGLFIVGGLFHDSFLINLLKKSIPLVVMGRTCEGIDSVNTDAEYAVYIGIKYLIEKGHRDILYLSGPDLTPSSYLKDMGYRKALKEFNIADNPEMMCKSEFTGLSGYQAVQAFYEKQKRWPSAIFTSSDAMAVGALRFLYEHQKHVPNDVSLATYDDSILVTHSSPAITSVCINKEKIGIKAAKLMVERLNNTTKSPQSCYVPVNLVERDSVKCVADNRSNNDSERN